MQIDFETANGRVNILVKGNLDQTALSIDMTDSLSSEQREIFEKNQTFVLNLNNVERVDTSGLAWVINAISSFKKQNKDIDIINTPTKLSNLAKLSNAESLIK